MSNPPANKPDDFDAFTIIQDAFRGFLETLKADPRLAALSAAVFFLHVRRALARLAEIWTADPSLVRGADGKLYSVHACGHEECKPATCDAEEVSEHEALTREEANRRLRAAGIAPIVGAVTEAAIRDFARPQSSAAPDVRAILQAYVRHLDLDKQAPALPIVAEAHEAREHTEPGDLTLVHYQPERYPDCVVLGVDPAHGRDETVRVTYQQRTARGSQRVDTVIERVERPGASAPYRPTDEQHQHPLCNALFMQGVTEREAIEALYRFDKARHEVIATLQQHLQDFRDAAHDILLDATDLREGPENQGVRTELIERLRTVADR